MKFPSIKNLADSAFNTLKRFPFEVLFALAGTIAATLNNHTDKYLPAEQSWYYRILMTANLGLLLSLATTLFCESRKFSVIKSYLLRGLIFIIGCSLLLLLNPDERPSDYLRFFLFSLSFHLLVSFAAFVPKGSIQGFWQFNKDIFLRFLTSVLYSMVLLLGLLAAINAANLLFNLKLNWHVNGDLFIWIAGMFNTLFFLAGVSINTIEPQIDFSYPKGLKVFTQYVLIPLATVYVTILLAYEIKIAFQWSLPKGLVSSLILGYAVFGILSILLIYPIREREENKWVKTYSQSFYFLLIPLIILLLLAAFARIIPYGITEDRYFLLLLAIWLLFISGYFLFSKKQNIKLVPVSLCLIALISIYGPSSAFSLSRRSQRTILIKLFAKYGRYKGGKILPLGTQKMSEKDGLNAVSKLNYLVDGRDINTLQGYIDKDLPRLRDSLIEREKILHNDNYGVVFSSNFNYAIKLNEVEWLTTYLGLDKFDEKEPWQNTTSYDFDIENELVLKVKDYDYVTRVNNGFNNTDTTVLKGDDISIKQVSDTSFNCSIYVNNEHIMFRLNEITDSLIKKADKLKPYIKNETSNSIDYLLSAKLLLVTKQSSKYIVTFVIDKLVVNYRTKRLLNVSEVMGYYLIKKKR